MKTKLTLRQFPSSEGSGVGSRFPARMVCAVALGMGLSFSTAAAEFSDGNWISMGGILGTDNSVRAAVMDGSGNLYIAGDFTIVGDVVANHIAKWNGTNWSALGSGMDNSVYALAVSGSDLYAGGTFTTAGGSPVNYIAKWNGNSWSALGPGVERADGYVASVSALAVSGSDLYAGGIFTTAGGIAGIAATNIAKWNGDSWSPLGSGIGHLPGLTAYVSALAVSGSDVYVGGFFRTAGGSPADYIAKWNGNTWSTLGSGMDYSVYALAVSGSDLYAGGRFTTAGGSAASAIAKWNGSTWSALGLGLHYSVHALALSGSDVYAGGNFWIAGGNPPYGIAKWNGTSWSALGSGIGPPVDETVYALAMSGGDVYAGGRFTRAGGREARSIAKWNGSTWSAMGSGLNGLVSALAASGSNVYAGGAFTTTGGRIAKWNESTWSAVGTTLGPGPVRALAVSGSDVYVAGEFVTTTNSGGVIVWLNRIAKLSGSTWSPLGSGLNGDVYALALSGSDLYAGGAFTAAGGRVVNHIAKWNGSSWSPLLSGLNGIVYALAVSGTNVYAGGQFTAAGGIVIRFIAKWDGSIWSGLGSGMGVNYNSGEIPIVYALAVSGDDVFAGGYFTTAGDSFATNIAKWNGSRWSALGSGTRFYPVRALAVSGSNVYAGGQFTMAGGSAAKYIAKWDGSNWAPLGSGIGGNPDPYDPYLPPAVYALTVSEGDLYAGGSFLTAGGKVSAYVARAYLEISPTLSMFRSGPEVIVSWESANTAGFVLEQAETLAAPVTWITSSTDITNDGLKKSVTFPATNSAQFFRLRRP